LSSDNKSLRVCLVLPPLTQLNTAYPSISYLARHLREQGWSCGQRDLGIELFLKVFSHAGLAQVFEELRQAETLPGPAWEALAYEAQHLKVVEPVIAFLQGRDPSLAYRILHTPFLPRGPRLDDVDDSLFGAMDLQDAARYRASLYLNDLVDLVRACVDPGFELNRYQHHLALGPTVFEPLSERLSETTLVDHMLDDLADSVDADVVCLSIPFPGNLYGALRIGRRLKSRGIQVLMGGGYVSTELRGVSEPRLWDFVDALVFDDGEGPLTALLEYVQGGVDRRHRTLTADGFHDAKVERPQCTKIADYVGLDLSLYLQLIDTLNPAHRLWADGRWNKMTLAHGCYWKRCAFCDIQLDYIAHYEPARIETLVDHMVEVIATTGQRGFHLVDEAAPPKLMRQLAEEILARGLSLTWWGNIRFEPAFTPDLARLLAASGLVAVTGGLEVASDRLLDKMDKGIDVDQVVRVTQAFKSAGVMVHAYLMFGFPTQTAQEGVDSMEVVRQMFEEGLLDSAFWHRFVLTRHSGVVQDPDAFGVVVEALPEGVFAANDLRHEEPGAPDWTVFEKALPMALGQWMQGRALERPLSEFFEVPVPSTEISPSRIRAALSKTLNGGSRLLWIGAGVLEDELGLRVMGLSDEAIIRGHEAELEWVHEVLEAAVPGEESLMLSDAVAVFPGDWTIFENSGFQALRCAGLLVL
jgi:hypothetical protein